MITFDRTKINSAVWNNIKVVPVVEGALAMISKNLKQHLKTMAATVKVELLQKAALLGKGRLL